MVEPVAVLACLTVAWVAWLYRPRMAPVVTRERAPRVTHGATAELGKWLAEHDVQAARFNRGDLVEVVMRERKAEADTDTETGRDAGDEQMSALDKALLHLSSGRHPDHVDAEEN